MAKEQTDRTTLDLFAMSVARVDRKPIRFRAMNSCASTNAISLNAIRFVELLNADAVDALNELAEARNMNRSDLIEEMLMTQLAALQPG
jgi:hypothetical protein